MASTAVALGRLGAGERVRVRASARWVPREGLVIWTLAFAFYITAAVYLVLHLHYAIDDAYARIDNAFNVLFSSDPHLAAIGFFWPPLVSFLELPLIAFKGLWPPLVTMGFAGSILSAGFSAGTVTVLNTGLRWAGVKGVLRWIICVMFLVNPMIILFSIQGMAEAPFIFFFVAATVAYLRWAESGRTSLLPLMGVLAGLDCLCRDEAFLFAMLLGLAVVLQGVRWRMSVREIETKTLLFALPVVFIASLWLVSAAIIQHDALYLIHASGTKGSHGVSRAAGYNLIHLPSWAAAIGYVIGHSFALFPGILAFLGFLGARLITRQHRLAALMLLLLGGSTAIVDIYLLGHADLGPNLRYQISVIPFAFLVVVYVLRSFRGSHPAIGSWMALLMAGLLGISNLFSVQALTNSTLSPEEAPAIQAALTGRPITPTYSFPDALDAGPILANQLEALDTDHGRILCDSQLCFPIVLNVPDAGHLFIVTSDRDFQAAAAQPKLYGVEYFLVSEPKYLGAFDELNIFYGNLYANGQGFSRLVGQIDGGVWGNYRLYRITGSTGRG